MNRLLRRAAAGLLAITVVMPAMRLSTPVSALTVGNYVTEFQSVADQSVTDIEINRTNGNVYAVGTTRTRPDATGPITSVQSNEIYGFMSKLDISGNRVWTKRIGRALGEVFAPQVARDSFGNLYVVMNERLEAANGVILQVIVEKWTDDGIRKWQVVLGGSRSNMLPLITFANNELVLAYGTKDAPLVGRGDFDVVLTRLVPESGRKLSQVLIGSSSLDMPRAITSMPNGDIVVVGDTKGRMYGTRQQGRTDEDHFLIQLPPDLGPARMGRQWGTRDNDRTEDVVALSGGGFIVVGYTAGQPAQTVSRGGVDGIITKIASNGNQIWDALVGSAAEDQVNAVEQSPVTGNILVTGITGGVTFTASAGECDLFGATINPTNGELLHSKQFGTPKCDVATSLKLRGDASPVIGGVTTGSFDGVAAQDEDGFVLSLGMQIPDLSQFVGTFRTIPTVKLPNLSPVQVEASEQSDVVGAPIVEATPPLCHEVKSPDVKWRREVATCAGLVVKKGTTTRIRLSMGNAPGVCSLSPRRRLKLTAPGNCKVRIRATQSNGSTKAVWKVYKVS